MSYTTEEKILYFKDEKIPTLESEIKAIEASFENTEDLNSDWWYNKKKDDLKWAKRRLIQLEKEQEYKSLVGNKPSTTLTIDRATIFDVCAEKILEFEVEASSYINSKFKTGKAVFEHITLLTHGLTLRCNIYQPRINRAEDKSKYTISFEYKDYTASGQTTAKIEKMKNK